MPEVALDGAEHFGIIVHSNNRRFPHGCPVAESRGLLRWILEGAACCLRLLPCHTNNAQPGTVEST